MTNGNGQKRWKAAGVIASAVLAVLAVGGAVWAAAAERERLSSEAAANTAVIEDHEARIRMIERELNGIATDVRWIRAHMEDR